MLKQFSILILGLLCSIKTLAAQQTVESHIKKIDSTISWIWDGGRTTTGNSSYFYGDLLTFYNANSTNGADRSYGYFLYYTYDMYCDLKNLKPNCLGSRLKVYFSINSTNINNKTMTVKVGGSNTTVSNYFQGIRSALFKELERQYGSAGLDAREHALIYANPKRSVASDFAVVARSNSTGNDLWKSSYPDSMLAALNNILGNVVSFYRSDRDIVASDSLFAKNQGSLLDSVRSKGLDDRITAYISNPAANDSLGTAQVSRAHSPLFVMKNCTTTSKYASQFATGSKQDLECTGRGIFLHELGHQMGLGHCSTGQTSPCTDNLANTSAGKTFLVDYLTNNTDTVRVKYEY